MLVKALNSGMDADAIAAANAVSVQMANFRIRTTGALVQVRRRR